jgi:hypothetical protein
MSDTPASKKSISPDWLVRGVLTKLGDTFDKLTGRGWKPSSSLATSELIEKLKSLLDAEAETSPDGRGTFIPHNIKLKMQWDKFSADSDESLRKLENELLTAAVDHINDKRYFTHKPLSVEVRPDYFTTGVKLLVSFERFDDEDDEASVDLLHSTDRPALEQKAVESADELYRFHYLEADKPRTVDISLHSGQRKSVGRTKENDISIDDPSVSKLHASLALDGERRLMVADTGSTNGTFLNGRRIAYGKAEVLSSDDSLTFGSVTVKIEHLPRPKPEFVPKTAAPTVAIGDFEFSSKRSEDGDARATDQPRPDTEAEINIEADKLATEK